MANEAAAAHQRWQGACDRRWRRREQQQQQQGWNNMQKVAIQTVATTEVTGSMQQETEMGGATAAGVEQLAEGSDAGGSSTTKVVQ